MVTIKDVAQDAGVSVGTVSNVINGGNVSEERRSRVEASIQKLGYQVNGLARGMRTQRTGYVVVMLPNITNPFYNMLLRDLEKALTGIGKQLVLCISDGDHKKEIKYIEMAKYNKVDGVIGVTFSNVEKYIEDSSAYVSIERCLPGVPCVSCDNYGGGWMAADSLIRRGAKNLLFFQTISSVENEVRKRQYGFEACCEANDVAYGSVSFSEQQVPSIYSSFSARNLINSVLRAHMENHGKGARPDGIFAGTDHLAVVIMEELRGMGLRVPENVQVIGYDGLKMLNTGRQLVSSIYQDTELIAKTSVDCLERLLNGEKVDNIINLPVTFIEGGSTLPLTEEK